MFNPDTVIYHANCADGFTSAWAFKELYGEDIEFIAASHGSNKIPNVRGKNVVIVDFCYKKDILEKMAGEARALIVIDHHLSAQKDLEDSSLEKIDDMSFNVEKYTELLKISDNNAFAFFDMDRSGAGMAWDFCFPNEGRPLLIDYVEDRDIWKFKHNGSRPFSSYLFSYEYTFDNWDMVHEQLMSNPQPCIEAGETLDRKMIKDIRELIKVSKITINIGGHFVPVSNLPYTLSSDAGNMMCGEEFDCPVSGERRLPSFAACYMDTNNGRKFSLRSVGDFDVSKVASEYGGGGHKNAAGFEMPIGWMGED